MISSQRATHTRKSPVYNPHHPHHVLTPGFDFTPLHNFHITTPVASPSHPITHPLKPFIPSHPNPNFSLQPQPPLHHLYLSGHHRPSHLTHTTPSSDDPTLSHPPQRHIYLVRLIYVSRRIISWL
ncbi:hypothetical protein EX30DRAFT_342456 [Ascodesmis nigricans]|uniref:Uncharacterized protein n=1 Tax=Ascodesmis nigricans TaxID=341454 RepID=A0A4S2MQ89_9PEZI|nr:hypothetical protein EX30DRAFT_342456 [Ascodesmis nigricans]